MSCERLFRNEGGETELEVRSDFSLEIKQISRAWFFIAKKPGYLQAKQIPLCTLLRDCGLIGTCDLNVCDLCSDLYVR